MRGRKDAELVLHVVTDLMGDDVRVGEVAIRADLFLHVHKEGEVDIDGLVSRAVERTHGGGGVAAARLHSVGEQHQLRGLVGLADLAELFRPDILGSG